MDANNVDIADNGDGELSTRYIAGRSPVEKKSSINKKKQAAAATKEMPDELARYVEFGKTIVCAIESGQGLYQFVWPKTHHHDIAQFATPGAHSYDKKERREKSVYEKLMVAFEEGKKNGNTSRFTGAGIIFSASSIIAISNHHLNKKGRAKVCMKKWKTKHPLHREAAFHGRHLPPGRRSSKKRLRCTQA